jgi:hypothetical protein
LPFNIIESYLRVRAPSLFHDSASSALAHNTKPPNPAFRKHARIDVTKSFAVDICVGGRPNERLRSASAKRYIARDCDSGFGTDESYTGSRVARRAEAISFHGQQDHYATWTVTNADQVCIAVSFSDANSCAFAFG